MRKFNWLFFIALTVIMGVNLTSCDDSLTEEEALTLQTELDATDAVNIGYSVVLVDATNTTILKSASTFSGAVVTIAQDGETTVKTVTDTLGVDMVSFSGLVYGYATVNIMMDDYSEVNYTIDLTEVADVSFDEDESGVRTYNAASIIPMLSLKESEMATIEGTITVETDLTNTSAEAAANITVLAMIDISSEVFNSIYDDIDFNGDQVYSNYTSNSYDIFETFSYGDVSMTTTTDANGAYSISVPAPTNSIEYNMIIPKYQASQTLYDMWETDTIYKSKSIDKVFGFGEDNWITETSIPEVSPLAIVTFSLPDYTYTPAELEVTIQDDNALDNATVEEIGGYYAPSISFNYQIYNENTETDDDEAASATATAYTNSYGQVYRVAITSSGKHMPDEIASSIQTVPYVDLDAQAILTVTSVDGTTGAITGLNFDDRGEYFISDVDYITINDNDVNGSGADIQVASFTNMSTYYRINAITIVDGGSNYQVGDELIGTVNLAATGKAQVDYDFEGGYISGIAVVEHGSDILDEDGASTGDLDVIISTDDEGTGATATAYIIDGEVRYVTVTDVGMGYSAATADVDYAFVPTIAEASVSNSDIDATRITDISLDVAGSGYGYTGDVTVTIQSNIVNGPGSGATATVEVSDNHTLENLELTAKGSNYRGNVPEDAEVSSMNGKDESSSITIHAGTTYVANIYLGTGEEISDVTDYEY